MENIQYWYIFEYCFLAHTFPSPIHVITTYMNDDMKKRLLLNILIYTHIKCYTTLNTIINYNVIQIISD